MTNSSSCCPLESIITHDLKSHISWATTNQHLNIARISKKGLWLKDSLASLPGSPRTAWQPNILPANPPSFLPFSFYCGQVYTEWDISQTPPVPSPGSLIGISHSPLHSLLKGPSLTQLSSTKQIPERVSFSNCLIHKHYQ